MFKKIIILFVLLAFAFSCENPAGNKPEDGPVTTYAIYRVRDYSYTGGPNPTDINIIFADANPYESSKYTLEVSHDGKKSTLYEPAIGFTPAIPYVGNVEFNKNANPLSISFTSVNNGTLAFRFNLNAMTVDRKENLALTDSWESGLVLRKM